MLPPHLEAERRIRMSVRSRFAIAQIESRREINPRRCYDVIDQYVFPNCMHAATSGIWMHAPPWPKDNARNAISGKVYGIGARPPHNRGRTLSHYRRLRLSESIDHRQGFLDHRRRIADIDIYGRLRHASARRKIGENGT